MNRSTQRLQDAGLRNFPAGTVFQWLAETPSSLPGCPPFRKGKFYLVTEQRQSFASPHDNFMVCDAVLCRPDGRPFKERHHPYAYALGERIEKGDVRIVPVGGLQ